MDIVERELDMHVRKEKNSISICRIGFVLLVYILSIMQR
jgi:hypothetical protein